MKTKNLTIKLGELTDIRTGHPFRKKVKNTPSEWNYYVLQLKDIQKDRHIDFKQVAKVNMDDNKPPRPLQQDDVLLRARGGYYYSGLFDADLTNVIAVGQFFIITPKKDLPENRIIDPAYLYWHLNQPMTQQYLDRNDTGSNIPMINKRTISDLPVTLPSIKTQHKIASIHQGWLKEQELSEKLIKNRQHMLSGMCQQLIQQDLTKDKQKL